MYSKTVFHMLIICSSILNFANANSSIIDDYIARAEEYFLETMPQTPIAPELKLAIESELSPFQIPHHGTGLYDDSPSLSLALKPQELVIDDLEYVKQLIRDNDSAWISAYDNDEVISHHGGNAKVFELRSVPGIIFKSRPAVVGGDGETRKRLTNSLKAQQIVHDFGLNYILIPKGCLFEVDDMLFYAEEKMDIGDHSIQQEHYEGSYDSFPTHPALREYFKIMFQQLFIFIRETGLSDVKYNNTPLDLQGRGITLVDLDSCDDDPLRGIWRWTQMNSSPGLVPDIFEGIDMGDVVLEGLIPLFESRQNELDVRSKARAYYRENELTGPEQISIDVLAHRMDEFDDPELLEEFFAHINKKLAEHRYAGLPLLTRKVGFEVRDVTQRVKSNFSEDTRLRHHVVVSRIEHIIQVLIEEGIAHSVEPYGGYHWTVQF